MSEEKNEMLLLMKELVAKIKALEETVYNQDNLLMKSGYVVRTSPSPMMSSDGGIPDTDRIAKMEWKEINTMVNKIEGGY